jgi:hypothetical protein
MRKTATALCSKMLTLLMALAPLLLLLLGLEVSQRLWRLLVQLAGPMSFGGAMCRSTIVGGVGFLFVVLPLVVIEYLFPASRLSMRSYAIGMAGFAAYFPLWDRLFGTVHMPVRGEYPPVGLTERPDGMTMRDFFLGVPTSRSAVIGTVPRAWRPQGPEQLDLELSPHGRALAQSVEDAKRF